MESDLVKLARETQEKHRELINQVAKFQSIEARREIRNQLEALEQDFTRQALFLTNTSYPLYWDPADPDHAVAIAVRNDIRDTAARLASLAAGEVLQKAIVDSFNAEKGKGGRDPIKVPWWVWAAGSAVVVVWGVTMASRFKK